MECSHTIAQLGAYRWTSIQTKDITNVPFLEVCLVFSILTGHAKNPTLDFYRYLSTVMGVGIFTWKLAATNHIFCFT